MGSAASGGVRPTTGQSTTELEVLFHLRGEELEKIRRLLNEREREIEKLKHEIQKLQSVLRETNDLEIEPILRTGQKRRAKFAVSGETWTASNATNVALELIHHNKDFRLEYIFSPFSSCHLLTSSLILHLIPFLIFTSFN